jgi:hypothetical protein
VVPLGPVFWLGFRGGAAAAGEIEPDHPVRADHPQRVQGLWRYIDPSVPRRSSDKQHVLSLGKRAPSIIDVGEPLGPRRQTTSGRPGQRVGMNSASAKIMNTTNASPISPPTGIMITQTATQTRSLGHSKGWFPTTPPRRSRSAW